MQLKHGPYSPSRLDTANCPYSFYRQYVDPNRPKDRPESMPQARGAAVHEIFEKITCSLIGADRRIPDALTIKEWVAEAIRKHPAAYEETADILAMVEHYKRNPPAVLTSDAETELRMGVALTEHGFEECRYDAPHALARGIADIMMISDCMTEAVVYDHKTQPNIEDAVTFQMKFYTWVVFRTHPFLKKVTTILHFARYGTYRSHEWTQEDMVAVEDEIMTRIAVIEGTEQWIASPHSKCQYCQFKDDCPRWAEIFEYREDGSKVHKKMPTLLEGGMEAAVKYAGDLNLLEEAVELRKKELKTYVSMTSPIAIPGKIYEFRAKEEVDWDTVNKKLKNNVYEVFEGCGIDPKRYMGFSATFTKDLFLTENTVLLDKLNALIPRKTKTEFRGYKL